MNIPETICLISSAFIENFSRSLPKKIAGKDILYYTATGMTKNPIPGYRAWSTKWL